MDSFELNKILGAVLATCLFTLALNIVAHGLFAAPKPEKPGYELHSFACPKCNHIETAVAKIP